MRLLRGLFGLLCLLQRAASDGDYDCFAGESLGNVNYFRNQGSWLEPAFAEIFVVATNPLSL